MQLNTVGVLCCPVCRKTLDPIGGTGGVIEEGALRCSSCQKEYPVRGGIPVFLSEHLSVKPEEQAFTALDQHSRQKVLQREWHDRERLDHSYKRVAYGSARFSFHFLFYLIHSSVHLFYQHRSFAPAQIATC